MFTRPAKIILWIALLAGLIAVDQATKEFAANHFQIFCNQGIAWGIALPGVFFIASWIVIVLFLIHLAVRYTVWIRFGALLALGGAYSNALDRITVGCVTDFIRIPFWPAFNLADTFILIGAIIVLISLKTNDQSLNKV